MAMLMNKRSFDFDAKIKELFDGFMQCEGLTSPEITKICAKLAPIAGLTVGTDALTPLWEKNFETDSEMVFKLTGLIEPRSGDIVNNSYVDYFFAPKMDNNEDSNAASNSSSNSNTNPMEILASRLEVLHKSVANMTHYETNARGDFSGLAIDVLREFSRAKTAFADMDDRIAKSEDAVRKAMTLEANALKREVQLHQGKYQALRESAKKLDEDIKSKVNIIRNLELLKPQLELAEEKIGSLQKQSEERLTEVISLTGRLDILQSEYMQTNSQLIGTSKSLEQTTNLRNAEMKQFSDTLITYQTELAHAKITKVRIIIILLLLIINNFLLMLVQL